MEKYIVNYNVEKELELHLLRDNIFTFIEFPEFTI